MLRNDESRPRTRALTRAGVFTGKDKGKKLKLQYNIKIKGSCLSLISFLVKKERSKGVATRGEILYISFSWCLHSHLRPVLLVVPLLYLDRLDGGDSFGSLRILAVHNNSDTTLAIAALFMYSS